MKNKIPFWVQIVSILLLGVIVSISILLTSNYIKTKNQIKKLGTHTVTFAYLDGKVIETKDVAHGKGVFPPILEKTGVFRGWSAGFNMVYADVEAHPVYHNITENNLFYFNSVYVKEGDEFSIDVCVGGEVNVSSGKLTLQYDPAVLKFIKASDKEKNTSVKHSKGKIEISFDFSKPLKTESLLSQLQFKAKKKDAYSTDVVLNATEIEVVSEGTKIPADCATINNKIFFLQEVDQ